MNWLLSFAGVIAALGSFGGSYLLYRGGKGKANEETQHIYITASDLVIDNLREEIIRQNQMIETQNVRITKQSERIKISEEAHKKCDEKYSQVIAILADHGISVSDETR